MAAGAGPAWAQLAELTTDELRLVYFEATQGYLAPHVARCFSNSMDFQRTLWGFRPSQPVTVLMSDFSDRGNAAAGVVPRNMMGLQIAPLGFDYETVAANERMNWLVNHETVHLATQDQAAGSDLLFRRLFGGKVAPVAEQPATILYYYLTAPRDAAPRWYHEGIAVFTETWMAGGMGRAQGAWDEMVFRSMVRDDSRFYDPLGLVSEGVKVDFQVEVNSYLYGTRFLSYLAYHHGPDAVVRWYRRRGDGRKYYSRDFKQVFGLPLDDAWHDWVVWEHGFQRANLEAIRRYPTTPYRDLSPRALGSVSRAYFDPARRRVYAAFNYPGVVAHVGAISVDDGTVEKLVDVKGPVIYAVASLAFDPGSGTLFYTTDNTEYRDVRSVDPETKRARTLLEDTRIGEVVFNRADRSLWGLRHFNGIATLVRIPHPYGEWQQVRSWPYGEVMHDLDLSPDGQLLSASFGEVNGRHTLRVWRTGDLLAGRVEPVAQTDFGASVPANFVFSPDGRYLFGSSYYTGASNIFRFEVATGAVEAVTNTETGFFRPIPLDDGSLIVFRYTGEGFVPAAVDAEPLEDVSAITFLGQKLVERYPALQEWSVGSPAEFDLEELVLDKGPYRSFASLGLESVYPVLEGYRDSAAAGVRVNLSDPLLFNRISLTASYSPDHALPSDERVHLDLRLHRYDWRFEAKLNDADFYDLFGPTKRSLKGYSLGVGHDRVLIYDAPRRMDLSLDVAFYGDLDQVPGYQNVASPYDELLWAEVRLDDRHVRSSLGHVDDEKGYRWALVAAASCVNATTVPSLRADVDLGFALPRGHSSVWLRTSTGLAVGDREDPFANFYFGGFGNNWVDRGTEKRYRDFDSFPGVEINEVGGRTFAKAMVEWNLPPLRFRRVGWPGFHLTWARTSLFASGLVTDLDDGDQRTTAGNVGVQVDFRLGVLSRLDMTLSIGAAHARIEGGESSSEVMVSLKIL